MIVELTSKNCVNSNWIAKWLADKNQESCQCGFTCKVRVSIIQNGHPSYFYVVTEKEYKNLIFKPKQR